MKLYKTIFLSLIFLNFYTSFTISQIKKKSKLPKYSISTLIGYNYVLGSAGGDVYGLSVTDLGTSTVFDSPDLGMQQGAGLSVTGKVSLNKKRTVRLTGNLGYNHFYNTYDRGRNRTRWHIFNLYPGVEYNDGKIFAGIEAGYSVITGAWQSDVTFPDNSKSNIYVKFKPANRIGLAVSTGMEFKVSRKMNFSVSLRGMWANIFPKRNNYSSTGYNVYINDSRSNNGIETKGSKEIIFIQLNTGLTFRLK